MADEDDNTETDDGIETEADSTRAKAEEIGKKLGVEKEEIPDFEIEEELEERLGKNQQRADADGKEKRRSNHRELTNREKRMLRKKRNNERFREKDQTIAALQEQNEALAARVSHVEGAVVGIDQQKLENDYKTNQQRFLDAEKRHSAAFKDGDGEAATQAMREMYQAQKNIDKIEEIAQQQKNARARQAQPKQAPQDQNIKRLADDWAERNSDWYSGPGVGDEDSDIAFAISSALVKQGYDPKSEVYWKELDKRIVKRMPHLRDVEDDLDDIDADDQEEDDKKSERREAPRKRTAPPVSGGSGRGETQGKVKVTLPKAFIETLKENGMWEDKAVRDRKIKYYMDSQRQSKAQ